jgi:hypothetical protein
MESSAAGARRSLGPRLGAGFALLAKPSLFYSSRKPCLAWRRGSPGESHAKIPDRPASMLLGFKRALSDLPFFAFGLFFATPGGNRRVRRSMLGNVAFCEVPTPLLAVTSHQPRQ